MALDPANFVTKTVNLDNFRMVSDNAHEMHVRAEFPADNKLSIQTILAGMSARAVEHLFPGQAQA